MNRHDLDLFGLETYYILRLVEVREQIDVLEKLHTELYATLLETQLLLHKAQENKLN